MNISGVWAAGDKTRSLQLQIEKNTRNRHYFPHSLGEHHFNIYDFWQRRQDKMILKTWWKGTRGMNNRACLLSLPMSPSQWTQLWRLGPLVLLLKIILQCTVQMENKSMKESPSTFEPCSTFFQCFAESQEDICPNKLCLPRISFGALFITNRYNKDIELPVSKYRMRPA